MKATEVTAGLAENNCSLLPGRRLSNLRADCLYTGISSGLNARYGSIMGELYLNLYVQCSAHNLAASRPVSVTHRSLCSIGELSSSFHAHRIHGTARNVTARRTAPDSALHASPLSPADAAPRDIVRRRTAPCRTVPCGAGSDVIEPTETTTKSGVYRAKVERDGVMLS